MTDNIITEEAKRAITDIIKGMFPRSYYGRMNLEDLLTKFRKIVYTPPYLHAELLHSQGITINEITYAVMELLKPQEDGFQLGLSVTATGNFDFGNFSVPNDPRNWCFDRIYLTIFRKK